MATPTKAHVDLAWRLLARDSASDGDAADRAAAAGRVYEKVFASLAPVIGADSVRALFARSVKLTTAEFPCLVDVLMPAEPAAANVHVVQRIALCLSTLEPAATTETATALYATFFGLMTTFIGEDLVRQLVMRAFPAIDQTASKETE